MKKYLYRAMSLMLVMIVLAGSVSVAASGQNYADISGHWAESTLRQALKDSIIAGYGNQIHPDDPITAAEAVTMLCRVFSNQTMADISGVTDVKKSDWFHDFAAKAAAMGMISPENGRLDMKDYLTRNKAFALLAEAFQASPAEPDLSVISHYSDGSKLYGKSRRAFASLVSAGLVKGYGGSLHIYDYVTRAEFLTVLYRIVSGFKDASAVNSAASGSVLLKGDFAASDIKFTGNVYCDCTSANMTLKNVTAQNVILRSDRLSSVSAVSSTIDRLVIAARAGDVTVAPQDASRINTTVVGTGGGTITLGGNISNVEVTGDKRTVVITEPLENILISGSNNSITIQEGAAVNSIRLLASGSGNRVTINGTVNNLEVTGGNCGVTGTGTAENVINNAKSSDITVNAGHITVNENYGLDGAVLDFKAPDTLPAGKTLEASVIIDAPANGKACRGSWYLNDVFASSSDLTLKAGAAAKFSYHFQYSRNLPKTAKLSFVLSFQGEDGAYQEICTQKYINLENYSEEYYKQQEINKVLAKITTGYKGNYTLAWAKANDYAGSDKEVWVNAKGYSGKTGYLIWVSIACQRVNIFTGSKGNWKLIRTFIVGTGAPGHDTPVGTWDIIGKLSNGWTNSVYTVKPVINFKDPSYGFHSRIYYPGTTKIQDSRIGFPCSHGCIRMYTEDVNWMYQYIPIHTTVVVY